MKSLIDRSLISAIMICGLTLFAKGAEDLEQHIFESKIEGEIIRSSPSLNFAQRGGKWTLGQKIEMRKDDFINLSLKKSEEILAKKPTVKSFDIVSFGDVNTDTWLIVVACEVQGSYVTNVMNFKGEIWPFNKIYDPFEGHDR